MGKLLWGLAVCASVVAACAADDRPSAPVPRIRLDKAALDGKVKETLKSLGRGVRISVWLGGLEGEPWYAWQETASRPVASSIKTAYLVELFAAHAGQLDDPLPGAAELLADDAHPAWAPFSKEERVEVRNTLRQASVRRVGEIMMGKAKAPNSVYNAAANLTTAVLGGPEELTKKIHKRNPSFRGIKAGRYMLAKRTEKNENVATAAGLAAVLRLVSTGQWDGLDEDTATAIREAMLVSDSDPAGKHYRKGGDLNSNPLTVVRSGWYERDGQTIVYVVVAVQPEPGNRSAKEAKQRLDDTAQSLRSELLTAARAAK